MRRLRAKRLLWIFIPVFLLLLSGGVILAQRLSNDEIGNLQIFKGSAEIIRGSLSLNGQTGTPVDNKDHIKAANDSTVALVLKDTTIIRLEAGSEVEVTAVTYQNGKLKDAEFRLVGGRMWSRVQPLASGANFDVETPTVTAAVRGTSFNTTFKNHITGIYVYHHIVEVTLNSTGEDQNVNRTQLLQMSQNTLQDDFKKGPSQAPNNFYDAWIKFNMQQDDLLCQQRHDIPGDCGEPTGIPKTPTAIPTAIPQVAGATTTNPTTTAPATTTTKPKTNPNPSPTPTPAPAPITLSTVKISGCKFIPSNSGPTQYQCTATAYYSDGSSKDVTTNQAVWSVSSTRIGTIGTSNGVYTEKVCSLNYVYAAFGGITSDPYPITNNC